MEKLQSYIVDNREKSHTGHTIKRRHGGGSKTKVNIGHESQWRMNGSLCATIAVDERNTGKPQPCHRPSNKYSPLLSSFIIP